ERDEDALHKAERYVYLHDVHMAHWFYHENQYARARELLDHCAGDQRGWEWHYLDRIMHADLSCLTGHTQPVHALAFAPHGRWLVSGSGDRTLGLWEPGAANSLQRVPGHSGPVWGVAFSPDRMRLASAAGSARTAGDSVVWDLTDGPTPQAREVFRVPGMSERAALAFHPTRPLLAAATGLRTGEPARVLLLDGDGTEVGRWEGAVGQGCVALAWS